MRTHTRVARLRLAGAVLAFVLAAGTACGSLPPAGPGPPPPAATPTATPVPRVEMSPAELAAALSADATAEPGVWALLAGLGVGVYTGDGRQVLAGSETRPEDFWLYDFEVPLLAKMATEPAAPFADYHARLQANGLEAGVEDTAAIYRAVYAAHPDAFLPRLFAAMGVTFAAGAELTPLQEWLLLLDSFMPPNGSAAGRAGRPSAWRQPGGPCATILGGRFLPNWGLVHADPGALAVLLQLQEIYYAIHGPLLLRSLETRLVTDREVMHEAHGGEPPDQASFTVEVRFRRPPEAGAPFPVVPPICGYLIDLDPPRDGPIAHARVWWDIGGDFQEHGQFTGPNGAPFAGDQPTETGPDGTSRLLYHVQPEEADGEGDLTSEPAHLEARLEARAALAALNIQDPRLLAYVPEFMTIRLEPQPAVTIEWHEPAGAVLLTFDSTVEYVLPDAFRSVSVVHAEVPIAANGIGQATLDYVSYVPELLEDNECSLEVTGFEDGLFTVYDLDYTTHDDGSYSDIRLVYEFSDVTEAAVLTCPVIGSMPYTVNGHYGLYNLLHMDERDQGVAGVQVVDWQAGSGATLGTKRYERSVPHPTGGTTTEVTTLVLTLADAGGGP